MMIVPCLAIAVIVTIFMGRQLTIMELGDDIARGLGQANTYRKNDYRFISHCLSRYVCFNCRTHRLLV